MGTRNSHHIHHVKHVGFSYPISLVQRLYSIILGPLIIVAIMFIAVRFFSLHTTADEIISFKELALATLATVARIGIAYALAVVIGIPLALLAVWNSYTEAIFLPIFDILESIPILAFFPVLIIIFINFNFLNGAAVFILFLAMLWNLVFTLVGGLKIIPKDIIYAAEVFNIRGFSYFNKVLIPAIFPQLVTGSILAVAQGWNIIIVAEVLHVYIPNGTASQDLFGIGSILVSAAAHGQMNIFIFAVIAMVLVIAFVNFFVWQKLLKYAQKYRFE